MFGTRLTHRAVALVIALGVMASTLAASGAAPVAPPTGPAVDVLVWGGTDEAAVAAVQRAGGEVHGRVPVVGGVATRLDARQRDAVRRAGLHVSDDASLSVSSIDTETVRAADVQLDAVNVGADWDASAGAGVGVALIDTGVTEVADLAGRVIAGPDLSGEGTSADRHGHGTFMAGLIAGDGSLSAGGTPHRGVAPGAHVVSVKVAGADGTTSLSKLLDAIGWVIDNAEVHSIRVLNLSVSVPPLSQSYLADPLSAAVEAAWSSGITVVAASGNDGPQVSSPGRDPWIITVGAVDTAGTTAADDDTVPSWSGRATSVFGAKPELLAPGVSVVSLLAPQSALADAGVTTVDGHYLRGSGTSMAAAMTSGAVAVLTERHLDATPDDYKGALVGTRRPIAGELGGMLDLASADVAPLDAGGPWWQRQAIAFEGLGIGLVDRMPWWELAGTDWAGTRWAGTRWAGTRWAGTRWAGTRWAGTRWAGTRWAGTRWAGTRWADATWSGGFVDQLAPAGER